MIHIPADMFASIAGGSGLEPMTVRAAHSKHGAVNHSATPARLQLINNFLRQNSVELCQEGAINVIKIICS